MNNNQLAIIENKITSPEVTKKLIIALNLDPDDEAGQRKAFKYASSVLAEIQKSASDEKKDLTTCQPDSIIRTMIDAANFQLAIDGRQHAHIIKYGNSATLQIGYRGYLAKIKEHYPDADYIVEPVYKGDKLKVWHDGDMQKYSLEKANAFNDGAQNLEGILFAISYTDNGRFIQKINTVPKSRIERAKSAAKQQFIWNSDYIEKAKAAAIKASCKIMFASIQGLQDIANYDNENNFDPNAPATLVRPSIVDNINRSLSPQKSQKGDEVIDGGIIQQDDVIEHETPELDESDRSLIDEGQAASDQGYLFYRDWVSGLSDYQKDVVRYKHSEWTENAREISKNQSLENVSGDGEQPPM